MIEVFVVIAALLQSSTPPPRSIDKGVQSGIETPRQTAVRDREAWSTLWRAHAQGRALPDVDFSREMVVAVFLGTRPTAGYGVEIAGYRTSPEGVIVEYRETSPPRDAITAQVLVSPYHIVAVPRTTGTVTFEKK